MPLPYGGDARFATLNNNLPYKTNGKAAQRIKKNPLRRFQKFLKYDEN